MIIAYKGIKPAIDSTCFIAQNAVISGDVKIGKNVGIWYGCVLRGDVSRIEIGENSNIQDGTTIHGTRANHAQNKTGSEPANTIIGKNVTVGHNCIIHAGTIEDEAFVGMGSVMMDLSRVETHGMLAAGSVLSPKKVVKSGELWAGVPAKFFRMLTQEEIDYIKTSADNYRILAMEYKNESFEVK
jgi:carbonic anhydrase/acetyltransferase-like protein (isoleucine patch superfamily)